MAMCMLQLKARGQKNVRCNIFAEHHRSTCKPTMHHAHTCTAHTHCTIMFVQSLRHNSSLLVHSLQKAHKPWLKNSTAELRTSRTASGAKASIPAVISGVSGKKSELKAYISIKKETALQHHRGYFWPRCPSHFGIQARYKSDSGPKQYPAPWDRRAAHESDSSKATDASDALAP